MSLRDRTTSLALGFAFIAVAEFVRGHRRSGWLCTVAGGLVLLDAFVFSVFASVIAGAAAVAAGVSVVANSLAQAKRH